MWPKQARGQEKRGTLFEQRVGAIMVDTALSGVVGAHVGDSDYPQGTHSAHSDNQGLVRKILSCSLTSKKQQVNNFNHQL